MTNKEKRVFVTGGAGFIGSNIATYHLDKGDHVWVVDNLQTGRLSNIEPLMHSNKFHFHQADLREWDKLREAVEWSDRIYHMAADVGQRYVLAHPIDTLSNNIRSFELVLEAASQAKSKPRIVLASTSELYGYSKPDAKGLLDEEALLSIPSGKFIQETYPIGKLADEVMAMAYSYERKIHCVIARIFNTIGLNQTSAYGMVVPTFIEQALAHKPVTVFGDGLQRRSFGNVHDTVNGLELLLETPEANGQIVNVGADQECSIKALAELIIRKTESRSTITYVPYKEAYGIEFQDIRERRPNLQKLKKLTGFQAKWTLEQTIEELIAAARLKLTASRT